MARRVSRALIFGASSLMGRRLSTAGVPKPHLDIEWPCIPEMDDDKYLFPEEQKSFRQRRADAVRRCTYNVMRKTIDECLDSIEETPDRILVVDNSNLHMDMLMDEHWQQVISYNDKISRHMRAGELEKVPKLVQEMKKRIIHPDDTTYNMLMKCYVSLKDIEGTERTMEEMKADGEIKCRWTTYAKLATIHIQAGQFHKANLVLSEIEEINDRRRKAYLNLQCRVKSPTSVYELDNYKENYNICDRTWRKPYHVLISLYSQASNIEGVNRVWESLKSALGKPTHLSYLELLKALARLGDTDGLQKYFEEYHCELGSSSTTYHIRAANVLICTYLSRDMLREAELIYEGATKTGTKLNFSILKMFMNFYLRKDQMDLAVKYMIAACSNAKAKQWLKRPEVVTMFFEYFQYVKDVDTAEKFFQRLKKINCIDSNIYTSLLRTYIAAGKVEAQMVQRIKDDGIEMDLEMNQLLEKVCPNLSNQNRCKEVMVPLRDLAPTPTPSSHGLVPEVLWRLRHFLIGLFGTPPSTLAQKSGLVGPNKDFDTQK